MSGIAKVKVCLPEDDKLITVVSKFGFTCSVGKIKRSFAVNGISIAIGLFKYSAKILKLLYTYLLICQLCNTKRFDLSN